ncbi:MAG: hypothetical protein KDC45_10040, partial [Bacteroidetes bacterium]|nr:hypothetical protein [Bacteroidota bacterium]
HCIHKFDRFLRYITSFGHVGRGDGEFLEPRSIAIWKRFGQVFVTDKESAQYLHIGTDVLNFEVSLQDSLPRFDFLLTEYSMVTARIYDDQDRYVSTLCNNRWMSIGPNSLIWDRTMNPLGFRDGRPFIAVRANADSSSSPSGRLQMPTGLYRIKIEARTKYIYNRYFTKKMEVEFTF